jgi:hypothetical protein
MKKLLIATTLMISSTLYAQEVLKIDRNKVESIELQNREVIHVDSIINSINENIRLEGRILEIRNPQAILNLELQNGNVIELRDIIGRDIRETLSGGQDGGGG